MRAGSHCTEETRQKIREANLGRYVSEENRRKMRESHLGKCQTRETREKISRTLKGRIVLEKTGKKISEAKLGHKVSEDTRRKISQTLLGHHHLEETKLKMSKTHIDRHFTHTEETKRQIGEANRKNMLGKCHTEGHKQKISEALKGHPWYGGGAKRVFYNNTWFRSGWEAKYAKWLDDNNIKWEYETHVFNLEIEGKPTTYRPDFYLPKFGIYHEVKGWSKTLELSLEKVLTAKKQYDINLTIIDEKWLRKIGAL